MIKNLSTLIISLFVMAPYAISVENDLVAFDQNGREINILTQKKDTDFGSISIPVPSVSQDTPANNKINFMSMGSGSLQTNSTIETNIPINKNDLKDIIQPGPNVISYVWAECGTRQNQWSVCLSYQIEARSAGHEHNSTIPPLEFLYGNYPQDFCRYNIPIGNRVYWYFRSPIFAAKIRFTGRFSGACQGTQSVVTDVRVTNLIAMSESNDNSYILTGYRPAHPYNHQATITVITALRKIAWQYKQEYSNAPPLNYNDFSLPWGGLFDIGPPDGQFWNPPHSSHRWGGQADVKMSTVPINHRDKLVEIFRTNGARVLPEPEKDHWHLDFTLKGDEHYEEELRCY